MLCESPAWGKNSGTAVFPKWPAIKKPARASRTGLWKSAKLLLTVAVVDFAVDLVHPNNLAMQRARNERGLVYLTALRGCDRHAIYFQRPAQCALVVGFCFHEVSQGAKLGALRRDQVALCLNDEIDRRCAELILLLLSVERLLLEFTRFRCGFHARPILLQCDESVAHIEQRAIFQLLHLRFQLALRQDCPLIVRLCRAV